MTDPQADPQVTPEVVEEPDTTSVQSAPADVGQEEDALIDTATGDAPVSLEEPEQDETADVSAQGIAPSEVDSPDVTMEDIESDSRPKLPESSPTEESIEIAATHYELAREEARNIKADLEALEEEAKILYPGDAAAQAEHIKGPPVDFQSPSALASKKAGDPWDGANDQFIWRGEAKGHIRVPGNLEEPDSTQFNPVEHPSGATGLYAAGLWSRELDLNRGDPITQTLKAWLAGNRFSPETHPGLFATPVSNWTGYGARERIPFLFMNADGTWRDKDAKKEYELWEYDPSHGIEFAERRRETLLQNLQNDIRDQAWWEDLGRIYENELGIPTPSQITTNLIGEAIGDPIGVVEGADELSEGFGAGVVKFGFETLWNFPIEVGTGLFSLFLTGDPSALPHVQTSLREQFQVDVSEFPGRPGTGKQVSGEIVGLLSSIMIPAIGAPRLLGMATTGWRGVANAMIVGGVLDFAYTNPDHGSMSTFLREIPGLEDNELLKILDAKQYKNGGWDERMAGRAMGAIEGMGIGAVAETGLRLLGWSPRAIRETPTLIRNIKEAPLMRDALYKMSLRNGMAHKLKADGLTPAQIEIELNDLGLGLREFKDRHLIPALADILYQASQVSKTPLTKRQAFAAVKRGYDKGADLRHWMIEIDQVDGRILSGNLSRQANNTLLQSDDLSEAAMMSTTHIRNYEDVASSHRFPPADRASRGNHPPSGQGRTRPTLDGKKYHELDLDSTSAKVTVTQDDLDGVSHFAKHKNGEATAIDGQLAQHKGSRDTLDADFVNRALQQSDEHRYTYELAAEELHIRFPDLSNAELRLLLQNIGADSGEIGVDSSVIRSVIRMGDRQAGRATDVGELGGERLAKTALDEATPDHLKNNLNDPSYTGTIMYLAGRTDDVPITVQNNLMAEAMGLPGGAPVSDSVIYEFMANNVEQLTRKLNSKLPAGVEPYQPWQVQSLLSSQAQKEMRMSAWMSRGKELGLHTNMDGKPIVGIHDSIETMMKRMEARGMVFPIDTNGQKYISKSMLEDPRFKSEFKHDMSLDAWDERVLFAGDPKNPRASVEYDDSGFVWMKFTEATTIGDIFHEIGHTVQVHAFSGARRGTTSIDIDMIKEVEVHYGIKDGEWEIVDPLTGKKTPNRKAQEAFANDFRDFVASGGQTPPKGVSLKTWQQIAAEIRDTTGDLMNSGIPVKDAARQLHAQIRAMDGLPIRWGENKYMPSIDWGVTMGRIKQWEDEGKTMDEILELMEPDDVFMAHRGETPRGKDRSVFTNANRLWDIQSDDDVKKLAAAHMDLTREMNRRNPFHERKSTEQLQLNAMRRLNDVLGRGEHELDRTIDEWLNYGSVDPVTGQRIPAAFAEDPDETIVAVQMMLMNQLKRAREAADRWEVTRTTEDYAVVAKRYMEYAVISKHAQVMRTKSGRSLAAWKSPFTFPSDSVLATRDGATKWLIQQGHDMPVGDDLVRRIRGLVMPRDARTIADVMNRSKLSTWGTQANSWYHEVFVSGLLSSPTTWFITGIASISPVLTTTIEGIEKVLGGVLRGDAEMVKEAITNFGRNYSNAGVAFRYALKTFRDEEAYLMGRRASLIDPGWNQKAIHTDSDNWIARGTINFTGQGIRVPNRGIMTVDEFFRQMNARTDLQAKLFKDISDRRIAEAISDGTLPVKANGKPTMRDLRQFRRTHRNAIYQEVNANMDKLIRDGRLRNQGVLWDEAMKTESIAALSDDPVAHTKAALQYVNDNWSPEHARLIEYGEQRAVRAVFQAELGTSGKAIAHFLNNVPLVKVIVPFHRTPSNLLKRYGGYSPTTFVVEFLERPRQWAFGGRLLPGDVEARALKRWPDVGTEAEKRQAASNRKLYIKKNQDKPWRPGAGGWRLDPDSPLLKLHEEHMADLASGDPRRMAQARGRQAMGASMILAGIHYATREEGVRISGTGPEDPVMRKQMLDAGWMPNSIFFPHADEHGNAFNTETGEENGTWVSYQKLAPYGMWFALIANSAEMLAVLEEEGNEEELAMYLWALAYAQGQLIKDASFLKGIGDTMEIFEGDPEIGLRKINQLITATTSPTGIAPEGVRVPIPPPYQSLARNYKIFDNDVIRETTSLIDVGRTNTWLGDPEYAPPAFTYFGEHRHRITPNAGWGTRWINFLSATKINTVTDDLAYVLLDNLDYPFVPPKPVKEGLRLRDYPGPEGYNWSAYQYYQERIGDIKRHQEWPDGTEGWYTFKEAAVEMAYGAGLVLWDRMGEEDPPDPANPKKTKQVEEIQLLHQQYAAQAWQETLQEIPLLRAHLLELHAEKERGRAKNADRDGLHNAAGRHRESANELSAESEELKRLLDNVGVAP